MWPRDSELAPRPGDIRNQGDDSHLHVYTRNESIVNLGKSMSALHRSVQFNIRDRHGAAAAFNRSAPAFRKRASKVIIVSPASHA